MTTIATLDDLERLEARVRELERDLEAAQRANDPAPVAETADDDDAPPWDEVVAVPEAAPEAEPEPEPVDPTRTTGGARIVLVADHATLNAAVADAATWPLIALDVETANRAPVKYDADGKPVKKERLDYPQLALRAIQFGNLDVVYVIDCALLPDWRTPALTALLGGEIRKVAHNKNFEFKVLKLHGAPVNNLACTMQAEKILELGLLPKSPSLAQLVAKYLGREMLKDVRDSFIEEREVAPLRPEQIRYAADDVDCLIAIYADQLAQLRGLNLERVAQFEWGAQRAFSDIELRGFTLDPDRWRALMREHAARRDAAHDDLFALFRPAAMSRWEALAQERERERAAREATIAAYEEAGDTAAADLLRAELKKLPSKYKIKPNAAGVREPKKTAQWDYDRVLTSHMQLRECFRQFGVEIADTNERTLLMLKRDLLERQADGDAIPQDALDAITKLIDFRELDTRVTRYGQAWLDAISPVTGRIHAEYDTLKDTARTGCSNPNIQNVPKREGGKVFRRCFVPGELAVVRMPDGTILRTLGALTEVQVRLGGVVIDREPTRLIVADYSQIELRVAAELSGDRNMIRAFNSGLDIHLATASLMFGVPPEQITKDQRTAAKCVNFGILFGIGPGKLAEQITNAGGVPTSLEDGRRFLLMYGKSYPRLMAWLAEQGSLARDTFETFTVLGHRRRFALPPMPRREDYPDAGAWKVALDERRGRHAGIEREGKNTPVQGTAACIAKAAILDLERILPAYGAGIVAFVHDEIVVEGPRARADEIATVLKEAMEAAGARFMHKVPCLAEVETGDNWLCDEAA